MAVSARYRALHLSLVIFPSFLLSLFPLSSLGRMGTVVSPSNVHVAAIFNFRQRFYREKSLAQFFKHRAGAPEARKAAESRRRFVPPFVMGLGKKQRATPSERRQAHERCVRKRSKYAARQTSLKSRRYCNDNSISETCRRWVVPPPLPLPPGRISGIFPYDLNTISEQFRRTSRGRTLSLSLSVPCASPVREFHPIRRFVNLFG